MKKNLIFLMLILLITITSCGESNEENSNLILLPKSNPKEVTINVVEKVSDEIIKEWKTYFLDKFNVELKINSLEDDEYTNILDRLNNSSINGFIRISEDQYYNVLENIDEYFVPIDEYVEKNKNWENLYSKRLKNFESIDGHIWVLPYDITSYVPCRFYNKIDLESHGITIPTTINEFRDLLYLYKNDNEKEDYSVIEYDILYPAKSLKDIFDAYEFCLYNLGEESIGYNYYTNSYEDSMYSSQAIEVMLFLRSLVSDNILNPKDGLYIGKGPENAFERIKNNNLGTYYSYKEGYPNLNAFTQSTIMLDGEIAAQKFKPEYNNIIFYAIPKNSNNKEDNINTFLETFYYERKGYLSACFAPEGKLASFNNEDIIFLADPDERFYGEGGRFRILNFYYGLYEINIEYEDPKLSYSKSEFHDIIDDGKCIDYNTLLNFPNIMESKTTKVFNLSMQRILDGKYDLNSIMKQYYNEMNRIGIQELISDTNRKIGSGAKYNYE